MRIKRYYVLAALILLMIIALMARLVQIQLLETESYSKHHINLLKDSVAQRTQEIVIDDGRGQFLDRFGMPLTYSEKNVLILFPFLKNTQCQYHNTILNLRKGHITFKSKSSIFIPMMVYLWSSSYKYFTMSAKRGFTPPAFSGTPKFTTTNAYFGC